MHNSESLESGTLSAALLPKPMSPEQAAIQQRLLMETVEPLQQMKVRLYSLYLPTIILDSEGRLLMSAYPDEVQELVKKIDAMIQHVADTWPRP